MYRSFFLVLALPFLISVNSFSSPWNTASDYYPSHSSLLLSEDGLGLMEPAIVSEPKEGGRWWYAPSRRAQLYSHRSKSRLIRDQLMSNKATEYYRLPGDILPYAYTIQLLPFIEEGNFTTHGHIDIFVDCVIETKNITMNSAEITINQNSVSILDLVSNSLLAVSNFYNEQTTREMFTIQTATTLTVGKRYKISLDFVSILNDRMLGFYRSSYMENGVRKWLAVTQLEPVDARRVFPCLDEPNIKANFTIVLGRKETMRSASNMPILETKPIDNMPGYFWDYYETTVRMSNYLVAFLVSDFVDVPTTTTHRVPFHLWVKPESQRLAEYSLSIVPGIQEFYEDYFKIDYPLPKQDLAAIPDYSGSAMENWGLVTYAESYILIDTERESRSKKQVIADLHAHEIAHQWFGNLVTMDWWNSLWLNEGFATFVEFLGTDAVEPDMRLSDQFVVIELHYVFGVDALETSRPINLQVSTPLEIDAMFDAITYDKGSCIIRMCADFIGLSTFIRGLTRYLNARSYQSAVEDDVWLALQQQVDEEGVVLPTTVKEIMDTWTLQMGFPLINVTRDYATGGAVVSQERFLLRKSPNSTDTHVYRWWVPLSHTSGANSAARKSDWISKDEASKTIASLGAGAADWVIFNFDQQNLYRVSYDATNYRLIAEQLMADHTKIKDNNRAQLLDDTLVLASVHMVPYQSALDLTLYLKHETEYVPWRAVLAEFNYIDTMLHFERQGVDWKFHLASLVTPYYEHVGFEESATDAHLTVFSRGDAMSWACRLQVSDCVTNSKAKYAELMNDPDNEMILSPNQKSVILKTGVENGDQAEWDFAFNQYKTKHDTAFLIAACSSKDSTRLYNLLEMMLDSTSGILSSDIELLFNYVASNPLGNAIATDFLVDRWNDIEASLGTDYFISFFRYVCSPQNTQEQLDTLLKLRDDHSNILGNSYTVQQGIDVVVENIKWMGLHQEEIGLWLTEVQSTTTAKETTTTSTPAPPSTGNRVSPVSVVFILATVLLGKFFIRY